MLCTWFTHCHSVLNAKIKCEKTSNIYNLFTIFGGLRGACEITEGDRALLEQPKMKVIELCETPKASESVLINYPHHQSSIYLNSLSLTSLTLNIPHILAQSLSVLFPLTSTVRCSLPRDVLPISSRRVALFLAAPFPFPSGALPVSSRRAASFLEERSSFPALSCDSLHVYVPNSKLDT